MLVVLDELGFVAVLVEDGLEVVLDEPELLPETGFIYELFTSDELKTFPGYLLVVLDELEDDFVLEEDDEELEDELELEDDFELEDEFELEDDLELEEDEEPEEEPGSLTGVLASVDEVLC